MDQKVDKYQEWLDAEVDRSNIAVRKAIYCELYRFAEELEVTAKQHSCAPTLQLAYGLAAEAAYRRAKQWQP